MTENEMIVFAKLLVQHVRDAAIQSRKVQLYTKNLESPTAKRWHNAYKNGDIKGFGEMIIEDTVDDTIFFLLDAIDNGKLDLAINLTDGKSINLKEEGLGELGGWYMGEWRSKYSNEQAFDIFK